MTIDGQASEEPEGQVRRTQVAKSIRADGSVLHERVPCPPFIQFPEDGISSRNVEQSYCILFDLDNGKCPKLSIS